MVLAYLCVTGFALAALVLVKTLWSISLGAVYLKLEGLLYYTVSNDDEALFKKEFDHLDSDGNKRVSKQELQHASFSNRKGREGRLLMSEAEIKREKPKMNAAAKKALFKEIDINNDGQLVYEEYRNFRVKAKIYPYRRRRFVCLALVILVAFFYEHSNSGSTTSAQVVLAQDLLALRDKYRELGEASHYYKMVDKETKFAIQSSYRCAELFVDWRDELQQIDSIWSQYNVDVSSSSDLELVFALALVLLMEILLGLCIVALFTSREPLSTWLAMLLRGVSPDAFVANVLETFVQRLQNLVFDLCVIILVVIVGVTLFFPRSIASVGDIIDATNAALAARDNVMKQMRDAPLKLWGSGTFGMPCRDEAKAFISWDDGERKKDPFGINVQVLSVIRCAIPTGSVWSVIVKTPYATLEAVGKHGILCLTITTLVLLLGSWQF